MTDIKDALRDYLETSRAVSLEEAIEVATTPAGRPNSRHLRPLLVAAAAATVVVLFVGGAALLTTGGTAPVVTQPPQPSSTIQGTTLPPDTTQRTPDTSQPQAPVAPAEVPGKWKVYSSDHGLPAEGVNGVAVGLDGTAWAAQSGSLYRLDGTRWSQVADTPAGGWQWMVATPDGGVAMSVSDGERAHRIMRFDGDQWVNETNDIIYISAVITGSTGPRVLGYDTNDKLVDIRFTDEGSSIKSASRHVSSGVSASFINISDTVDVDSEGTAWFGSVEGAWRFDGDTLELFEFGVHGDCCAPLAVDEHDNVWIQLAPHGDLFVLSPNGQRTQYEPDDGIPFLRQGDGLTIVPTSDGSVWVLGRGGVAWFDGDAWTSYRLDEARAAGIPTMRSYGTFGVVDGPDGSTWTVQQGQGTEPLLHRFLDGRWKAVPIPDISWGGGGADYGTLGMALSPDGSLWVPTTTGVAHFQPNSGIVRELQLQVSACPMPAELPDDLSAEPWLVDLYTAVGTLVEHTNALGDSLTDTEDFSAGWDRREPVASAVALVLEDLDTIEAIAAPFGPLDHELLEGVAYYRDAVLPAFFKTRSQGTAIAYFNGGGETQGPCGAAAGNVLIIETMLGLR